MKEFRGVFLACFALGILSVSAAEREIDSSKSLLITHLSVLDDPRSSGAGSWSFGTHFARTVQSDDAAELEEHLRFWLRQWDQVSDVNGFVVSPRVSQPIRDLWPRQHRENLSLDHAPFRLIGITFRPDLREPGKPAGEGRLMYCLFDPITGRPFDFTVIFEYALPTWEKWNEKSWARAIAGLSQHEFGEGYNKALERLTNYFSSQPPAQVRTNDFFLEFLWELREFRPDSKGRLAAATTMQNPDGVFLENSESLLEWIQENEEAIQKDEFVIPDRFLGGSSIVDHEMFMWFEEAGLDEKTRHHFSVATCNGCHGGDTDARFTHVDPREEFGAPMISEFLMKDLEVRERDLEGLLRTGKSQPVEFKRRSRVH